MLSPIECDQLLASEVVVEEKLDGANIGLSVGGDQRLRVQNRGQYLHRPFGGQFTKLGGWLELHEERLTSALGSRLIAFGEWCAARHSLSYSKLPDWLLLFDIYDREEARFWSTRRRDVWADEHGLACVAEIYHGLTTIATLNSLVSKERSRFRSGSLEGIVIRRENADWLLGRAKMVRADFTQAMNGHWGKRTIEWNSLLGNDR